MSANLRRNVIVTIRHAEAGNVKDAYQHPVALAFQESVGEDAEVCVWLDKKQLAARWLHDEGTIFYADLPDKAMQGKTGRYKLKWASNELQIADG